MRIFRTLASLGLLLLLLGTAHADPEQPDQTEAEQPAQTESEKPAKDDFLNPSGGQFGLGKDEGFGLGTAIGDPTALNGPTRVPVVLYGTDRESLIQLIGHYTHKFGEHQRFLAEGYLDPNFLGLDLGYTIKPEKWDGALSVNGWVSSGSFAPFNTDGFEVRLPPFEEPQVQMVGGGVEYVQPFTEDLDVAFGLNFEQYAFADDLFSGNRFAVERNGFPLTVSGTAAAERLYTFRVNGLFSTLDDRNLPTRGTKLRFGLEQAFDIGASSTSYNRLSTNIAQYIKMPGFNDGDHNLVLNVQAGTILGDPPPIRAFHLGGSQSVRGYDPGELASGKSFFQGSVEYRHFLRSFNIFDTEFKTRAVVFYDYGTTFGTASQLKGMPPYLSNKPDSGYGYGAGLQAAGDYGLFRLETAWNREGRNSVYFTVGERF